MILLNRLIAWLERILQRGRHDRAREQRAAGRCIFHDPDAEYWCREPAVEDGFCWGHRPDEDEDDRAEWDDEDEPRAWWRYR